MPPTELELQAWKLSGGHTPMCGCISEKGTSGEDPNCRYTVARKQLRREFRERVRFVSATKINDP
jgi:hypothetical protein